ncbi:MAG: hypothetical protein ABIM50_10180 [Novosphingobium sp.]
MPLEVKSLESLIFEHWMRTGFWLTEAEGKGLFAHGGNPYHDPRNGQFTSGPEGTSSASSIKPTVARATAPRTAAPPVAARTPQATTQARAPVIAPIRGYREDGPDAWRQANDAIFKKVADDYNRSNGLKPADVKYMHPKLMKAWAMVESGGNRNAFLTDPFQVNKPLDWDKEKPKIGLQYLQAMTPEASARAALLWLDKKGNNTTRGPDGRLVTRYMGQRYAFRNYNGNTKMGANGREHRDNYVTMISYLFHN